MLERFDILVLFGLLFYIAITLHDIKELLKKGREKLK